MSRSGMLLALFSSLLAAACAGRTPVPEPTVAPEASVVARDAPAVSALQPSAAAVAAADSVELTGTEMGTMWTFENAPLDYWEETYGFRPSSEWLEHARLSSLRYGTFCSASFVSPNGLVMTNHHCARSCVDAVATAEADYLNDGFLAASREDEATCPGLHLDQLVEMSDKTEELLEEVRPDMTPDERVGAIELASEEIVTTCEAEGDRVCQVVTLFNGGQYMLYEYRRYDDVRLVFAPELSIGFFGGDPDNFTYPRYNLDVSFVRAYGDDGSPIESNHYFAWDPTGPDEGDAVFVTGHPGSTSRQITVSQYMYEREIRHPLLLEFFDQRLETLHGVAERDPERGRALSNTIFGLENTQKLYRGELKGLRSTELTARKVRWEEELKRRLAEEGASVPELWSAMAAIQDEKAELYPHVVINSTSNLVASQHLALAGVLVAWVRQMALPENERGDAYRGDAAAQTRQQLEAASEIDRRQSVEMLAGRLDIAGRWLDESHPLRAAVQAGESPLQAAARLIDASRVGDADFRRDALAMTADELEATGDPLVSLAARLADAAPEVGERWNDVVERESAEAARFADAVFAAYGTDLPPDATFTLRISDGVVERYPYNGTFAPPVTTLFGLYARSAEFENEDPWTLPERWLEAIDRLDLDTPLNFVSTNDITGGNSGSPLIDRDGRVVGIAFDGNVESFPNEFLFAAAAGRTVSVHSAGILEILRGVYEADRLADELEGEAAKAP